MGNRHPVCTKTAAVGWRWFPASGVPPLIPVGARAARTRVPIGRGGLLGTWGDDEARQWWISLGHSSRNISGDDTTIQRNDQRGTLYPGNVGITRALITIDDRVQFEHDFRGVIITPPSKTVRVELLAPEDAVRLDLGPLPESAGASLVFIDEVSVTAWQVSDKAGDQCGELVGPRQSRGFIRTRIVDTFYWDNVINQSFYLALSPWATRLRVRTHRIAGQGALSFQLLGFADNITRLTIATLSPPPAAEQAPWVSCAGAVGLLPVVSPVGAAFTVHVETESEI